jgi:hypothetical protein
MCESNERTGRAEVMGYPSGKKKKNKDKIEDETVKERSDNVREIESAIVRSRSGHQQTKAADKETRSSGERADQHAI